MIYPSIGCWNDRGLLADGRLRDFYRVICENNLDLLCLIETKLNPSSYTFSNTLTTTKVFHIEKSHHNFFSCPGRRLFVKWNSSCLTFIPTLTTPQILHADIKLANGNSFSLSCVYAHNSGKKRCDLWETLWSLTASIHSPWMVCGDFNCVLYTNKKEGGNPISPSYLTDFRDYMMDSDIMNLPSSRLFFTWLNLQKCDPIRSKLDRVLCNPSCLEVFPQSCYKIIGSHSLDHSPLIIQLEHKISTIPRFILKNY